MMDLLPFMQAISKLKRIQRTGWVEEGIPNPESVADHSFSVAILAMVLAPHYNLDQLKCLKMALIHDVPESKTGDIVTTRNGISAGNEAEKHKQEIQAAHEIFSLIHGSEYVQLFEEYELQQSPEAKLIKQLDKFDMALMAQEYEAATGKNLEGFFVSAKQKIDDEKLMEYLEVIEESRTS